MILPIRDDIQSSSAPLITVALIAGCGVAFYYQWANPATTPQYAFDAHKLVATEILRGPAHVLATLVTSVFLHANLMHIGTNMLFLWIFGDNVEDRLGKIKFPLFYVLCGVAGNLAQAVFSGFRVTMIGASGAVAGVLAAYFISFRGSRVLTFIFPWSLFAGLIPIPARFFIFLWIVLQVFAGAGALAGQSSNVAWFAHIGGFAAGWLLCKWMCPKPRPPRRGPRLEWIEER
ncbi:MAG: rhomboid family intramembrane serine protease [Armatimonadota bacterium]